MAKSKRRDDSGFALLTVIWAVFVLSALCLMMAKNGAIQTRAQHARSDHLDRKALAEAAFYRVLFSHLVADDPLTAQRLADGQRFEWDYKDQKMQVTLEAEGGKIDLNRAEANFVSHAIDFAYRDPVRSTLLDAVDRSRSSGQRLQSLAFLEKPAFVARARFPSRPLFTINADSPGIDPASASEPVLLAIPGMSAELAKQTVALRSEGKTPPGLSQYASYFARGSEIYRVTVSFESGQDFLSAVIDARPAHGGPRIVIWRERY